MIVKEFYITDKNGKSNCVVRSLCKILNKKYDDVYNELCKVAEKLNYSSFNDVPVFEKYMEDNGIFKIDFKESIRVSDLKIHYGSYIVFCYDKKEYYHMFPIINNIIYDKQSGCTDLYVISIYEKKQNI